MTPNEIAKLKDAAEVLENGSHWDELGKAVGCDSKAFRDLDEAVDTVLPYLRNMASHPLTVDQLKLRNKEPVWIEDLCSPESSQWMLIFWHSGKYLVLLGISRASYSLDEYGERWLAYDIKPSLPPDEMSP